MTGQDVILSGVRAAPGQADGRPKGTAGAVSGRPRPGRRGRYPADVPLFGPLLALGAAVCYGAADFAGGMLSRRRPAVAVVGVSQACSLLLLLLVLPFLGWPGDLNWVPWSILAGATGGIGLVAFYSALSFGTVGVVSPISATGAVIPVAIGLASGESPSVLQVGGIVLALLGAVLASGPELRGEEHVKARAVWFAGVAAVGFGLSFWAIARGSASSTFMTLIGMRTTTVVGFGIAALVLDTIGGITARELPALAGVGLMDVAANGLLGVSTVMGLLSVSAVLTSLYPVITVTLAAIFLHERLKPIQVVGVGCALAGVALIAAG